ncbi:hypothetical protein [Pseudoalteromonas rubra]|uniref:Uncharacterized protein n=1 Tax=Pseudoalteromonas rubra TaxID=43658 RepID=A0A5S3X3L4_9GAMM|nr:hypothetical protein [Pseudoalteromonas rubra]TMP39074.1 hypothetical protein CWB98_03820 [Pseudoalteromonas rubra]
MQLPSIPTDNLYKFLSISGIWIFLIFLFIPQYLLHITYEKVREIKIESSIIFLELEGIEEQQRALKDLIAAEENKMNNNEKAKTDHLESKLTDIIKFTKDLQIARIKHEAKTEEIKYYYSKLIKLDAIQSYGVFGGVFISLLGFILWYFMIQRVDDKQRLKELEK